MKQTAVEWLFEEMSNIHSGAKVYVNANKKIVEQAKAMEKQQMIDFADSYEADESYKYPKPTLEQYYNETFNK